MTNKNLSKSYPRLLIKITLDIFIFLSALIISYIIRFTLDSFFYELKTILLYIPLIIAIRLGGFAIFRIYTSIWRYAGIQDLLQIAKATTLSTIAIVSTLLFISHITIPRSIIVTDWLLVIFFASALRLIIKEIISLDPSNLLKRKSNKRVLIYGAGRAGEMLLHNIENTREVKINVIGFLDDNIKKHGNHIHNKRIFGDYTHIPELVNKYNINEIYFSIPSLSGFEIRKILKAISEQVDEKVEIKTMPGLMDLVSDRVTINELRKFEIKDLLRRKPVNLDFSHVKELINSQIVMVVGGGGSIGLELCRQIASFKPKKLVILDNSEYNLYLANEMIITQYPDLDLVSIVADATNEPLMHRIFNDHIPQVLFHAAAYKHVPLMEFHPWSAVQNNLLSTLTLAKLSIEHYVKRFILISTDKAVQPTSVMGVTKRMCEIIARIYHQEKITDFIVVRFGNVLGSSGSVIPKFKKQINEGGPITVTHPDISRYFMLISEAVELVLQAGAVGISGNTYVLDMGEPIRIADLAKYMIELSGLKVGEDIEIKYTGLRPGEKLRESLYFEGEETATRVPNLLVLEPKTKNNINYLKNIHKLLSDLNRLNHDELVSKLKEMVPEYQSNSSDNGKAVQFHKPKSETDLNPRNTVSL
ncbi:MAG: nucleoside-diphosphate sugar epimerase/dehydratase [Candidatus Hatepunaea meridiana]|nr:nucleoside-diphosphate sugar epimerase/dehydratase [Candidatus Hatepunaea meridiana]